MKHILNIGAAALLSTTALTSAFTGAAQATQTINQDLVVVGSLCVGTDCTSGESFGFDTIRLKENNLRIRFQDTSVSASFPSNDWQIVANESGNGGANKFSIEDIDGGRIPFTIEAGAPLNALYVDDGGRIGMGTGAPLVEAHMLNGDSPTLRLEQDGSSGFQSQTWDVAGNETNFFVRDVTNGSALSFRIRTGAPAQSLFIDTDGDIGFGTQTPDAPLDVEDNAATTLALFQGSGVKVVDVKSNDNNPVQYRLQSDSDNRRLVALNASGTPQSQVILGNSEVKIAGINDSAELFATFSAAGIVTNIGTCTTANPCDGVFDPEIYEVPTIEEHAAKMWGNKYLPAVGPTQNGPVNMNAKMTGMLNELEHAHIFIQQLNERIAVLETALDAQ
ncbi:hypothetical protein [Aestuariivita sp.]|jgi:hypothetical protein|uniref:hypothetical protein n=1 Tax=Aestuariivita sp. TaxID=1872407 RepID=UPI0021739389|nr:hypothetical protein [Aestuariivita sp.]MCE8008759.1 hypothetical protein [Aestuariivita sp.]